MKQIITKELVEKAIADLKAGGKKITLTTLHAALGNRGSMTTLLQIKAELKAAAQPVADSDEGLKTFREVWALAKEEGRKLQEAVIADLQEDIKSFSLENERLEGVATAAETRADEAIQAKLDAEAALAKEKSQLAENQEGLIQTGKETRGALEKLAAEQAAHQKTQQELRFAIEKAHALELDILRLRALQEGKSGRSPAKTKTKP